MRFIPAFLPALIGIALQGAVHALPKAQTVEYKQDTASLEGILVYDVGGKGKKPGVVLFSDWMGVSAFAKTQAQKVASLGYIVFIADVYGKGKHPADAKEAGNLASIYKNDRTLMRARAAAGLAQLKAAKGVDTTRLAAMGYCFGGGVALELGRSGADLDGIVSVHGNLDTPDPSLAKNIKGQVMILHGADDPFVPPEQVKTFQEEMRNAKVDWRMTSYGGAVHAFTNPEAGNDPSKGAAYNAAADLRSWQAMKDFYSDLFAPTRNR